MNEIKPMPIGSLLSRQVVVLEFGRNATEEDLRVLRSTADALSVHRTPIDAATDVACNDAALHDVALHDIVLHDAALLHHAL